MVRTQIQLDKAEFQRAKAFALGRGISFAELVRMALKRVLESETRPSLQSWAELRPAFRERRAAGISDHDAGFVEAIEASKRA